MKIGSYLRVASKHDAHIILFADGRASRWFVAPVEILAWVSRYRVIRSGPCHRAGCGFLC